MLVLEHPHAKETRKQLFSSTLFVRKIMNSVKNGGSGKNKKLGKRKGGKK